MTPPVVVLRGNDICFLGIIRSLAKAGIPFLTVTFTWDGARPWWSEASRYFVRDYTIENPFTSPESALDQVEAIGRELKQAWGFPLMVIPSSDTNLMLFIDNEERLSPYFCMMGDRSFGKYRADVTHKYNCSQLLLSGSSKICPRTFRCNSKEDIAAILESTEYPVVFKPAVKDYGQSFYAMYKGLKAVNCDSREDLERGLLDCVESGFDVIVQEKIIFDKVEDEIPFYGYVDKDLNIRVAATGIKEVIQPYPFGTANVLRLSWHPELLEQAREVVRLLQWRGIIMIEFIRDKRDGIWKVIEINVRPWLFIGFYDRFGLHYLSHLYQDWLGFLESGDRVVVPRNEILEQCPVHIDLNSLVAGFSGEEKNMVFENGVASLKDWLFGFGQLSTLTYFDHDDQAPDDMALSYFCETTGILRNEIEAELYGSIFNPSGVDLTTTVSQR